MEFGFSEEQTGLREVTAKYLRDRYPAERVAEIADSADGFAAGGWEPLAGLGWFDADLGMVERAILAEESGYALHPVPWWPALALGASSGVQPTALILEAGWQAAQVPGGWQVSGHSELIAQAASAADIVIAATSTEGPALMRVRAKELAMTPRTSLDGLRRMATVSGEAIPAELMTLGTGDEVRWRSEVLLAAEGVGVARRAYDFARAHAATRTQFGRPIGTYQGVGFRIADTYVAIELAMSLAYRAAWLAGQGSPEGISDAVSCAIVASRDAAMLACEHAIQVLGGIGMTWEHPVHRWYRRALWLEHYGTSSAEHREQLATTLLS